MTEVNILRIDPVSAVQQFPEFFTDPTIQFETEVGQAIGSRDVYAFAYGEGNPHGICVFVPVTTITWEFHGRVLPRYRTREDMPVAIASASAAVDWMFENTPCRKVTATVPAYFKGTIEFLKNMGFTIEGKCPKSILINDKLSARYYFGKNKE